jgi:hypothetical protein
MTSYGDLTYFISNSELQAWKRCRRKWWLAWHRKMTPKISDLAGLLASGSRVHEVMSFWYQPNRPDDIDLMQVLDNIIERDRKLMIAEMQRVHADELIVQSRTTEFDKAIAYERAMIEGYVQWIEDTGIDADFRVIDSEVPMIAPLTHIMTHGDVIDVFMIGILDVRVSRNLDGSHAFIDHKTTASLTQPLPMLRQNEQMLHYILLDMLSAYVELAPEIQITGAYYNMLKRVKRTGTAKPPFFDRVYIPHSPAEIESYRKHLIGTTTDILRTDRALTHGADPQEYAYPSIRNECTWDCQFFSLCHLYDDGSHAEAMLETRYMKHDPLERYRKTTTETPSECGRIILLTDDERDVEE